MNFFTTRLIPSTTGSPMCESEYHGRDPPRPPPENVLQLFQRLHHVEGDTVRVYASEDDYEPIFVQEGLLRLIFRDSLWYKFAIAQMELKSTNRLVLYTQEDVLAMFLFWIFNTRVPGLHEVGQYPSIPSQDDEDDYQTLLVRTWVFADSVELPGLQNTLMTRLFDAFDNPAKDISGETLQICLLVSESGTKMRWALLQYFLWWEDHSEQTTEQHPLLPHPRLQPYINFEGVKEIEADLEDARMVRRVLDAGQRKKRPVAKSFLVFDQLASTRA
ncbi:hypothetical protein CERZMDRAFT_103475 [Cercospora zeae-maydis SCOH1-5]|uniref:BTB domain-containing protein n=1 Tax=Cercospora zeae-maydis SCOH1-5 TaxID=717836 RepID=A0A6A6EZ23_9PEZI|nr:hypothetical protein CERZMDRAFT_103475 [Cercospora zeae-maydis SCOH1-5]